MRRVFLAGAAEQASTEPRSTETLSQPGCEDKLLDREGAEVSGSVLPRRGRLENIKEAMSIVDFLPTR
jgi:hypothetical protein